MAAERNVLIRGDARGDMDTIVSSLAQICLDSYFRTISGTSGSFFLFRVVHFFLSFFLLFTFLVQGFCTLVQKEWVRMGFAFADRCAFVTGSSAEQSPMFLLFLDCVHQLMQQFPLSFQFSYQYLQNLYEQVLGCLHGTFLYNCDEERARSVDYFQTSKSVANENNKYIKIINT